MQKFSIVRHLLLKDPLASCRPVITVIAPIECLAFPLCSVTSLTMLVGRHNGMCVSVNTSSSLADAKKIAQVALQYVVKLVHMTWYLDHIHIIAESLKGENIHEFCSFGSTCESFLTYTYVEIIINLKIFMTNLQHY